MADLKIPRGAERLEESLEHYQRRMEQNGPNGNAGEDGEEE
jgi:hypothetical protein